MNRGKDGQLVAYMPLVSGFGHRWGVGFGVLGDGFRVRSAGTGLRVLRSVVWGSVSRFRVEGRGFKVRVQGSM